MQIRQPSQPDQSCSGKSGTPSQPDQSCSGKSCTKLIKKKTAQKKPKAITVLKKEGGGVRPGMIMITDSMFFFYPFPYRLLNTNYRLVTTEYQLPTTDERLPTTDYRLPTTDNRLPTNNYQLLTTDYRLPTTGYRLQTTDYRLPTTDYQIPTTGWLFFLAPPPLISLSPRPIINFWT